MDLQIAGRNLELDPGTRDYVTRKLNRLERHLAGITTATVELVKENTRAQGHRVVAQVTLNIDGTVLRGEERGSNAKAAVDSAIAVMDRRIARYKGKAYRSEQAKRAGRDASLRTPPSPPDALEPSEDEEVLESGGKVVRVKRFPVKPMTLEDAAFQMELLGHDFFLFLNSETDEHSVLYRRHDGGYGLIQPEPL